MEKREDGLEILAGDQWTPEEIARILEKAAQARVNQFMATDEGQAYIADVYGGLGALRYSEDGSIERVSPSDFIAQIEE